MSTCCYIDGKTVYSIFKSSKWCSGYRNDFFRADKCVSVEAVHDNPTARQPFAITLITYLINNCETSATMNVKCLTTDWRLVYEAYSVLESVGDDDIGPL